MLEQLNNARGNDSLAESVVQHGSVLVIERVDVGILI